jgi:hypothetical protein
MDMSNHLPSFPHRLGTATPGKAAAPTPAAPNVTAIQIGLIKAVFSSTLSIGAVIPSSGPSSGGQTAILSGSGFLTGLSVTFGGEAATVVRVLSSAKVLVKTPANKPGTVDVVVKNPDGQSAVLAKGYTYDP